MEVAVSPSQSSTHPSKQWFHWIHVALILGALSYGSNWLNATAWGANAISILWPSTGFLIGVLLCLPRRIWPRYLAIAFVIDVWSSVSAPLSEPLAIAIYLAACNFVEVLLAAGLLHRRITEEPDLAKPHQLLALLGYGALIAPCVTSMLASVAMTGSFEMPTLHGLEGWFTSDALGIAITTPLYLSLYKRSRAVKRTWFEMAGLFVLLIVASIAVFSQTSLPLLFVIVPFLLLIGVRCELFGSAMGLLAVSVIGGYFTAKGQGPVGLTHLTSSSQRILAFQFFIGVCVAVLYIVEVLLAQRKRFEKELKASEQRFRLLAEGTHDMILHRNLQGDALYVSPAVKVLLGWEPGEFAELGNPRLIHPDDLAKLIALYKACREGKVSNTLDFRCRKKDGGYLWVQCNLALHRDPEAGDPAGFINVARDISNRKAAEEELNQALNQAKSLASIDPLTEIANRRTFDAYFEIEWRRSIRTCSNFSLLLLDIDCFKQYNDLYGHPSGDHCLREIAKTIKTIVHRSTDLLARYGGEEFVVVLPDTDSVGAQLLAEQIRRAVELQQIHHEGNPHGVVTLSIGCATQTPERNVSNSLLLGSADAALYNAKSSGKNCVKIAAPN